MIKTNIKRIVLTFFSILLGLFCLWHISFAVLSYTTFEDSKEKCLISVQNRPAWSLSSKEDIPFLVFHCKMFQRNAAEKPILHKLFNRDQKKIFEETIQKAYDQHIEKKDI